jgi:hypothetical protein
MSAQSQDKPSGCLLRLLGPLAFAVSRFHGRAGQIESRQPSQLPEGSGHKGRAVPFVVPVGPRQRNVKNSKLAPYVIHEFTGPESLGQIFCTYFLMAEARKAGATLTKADYETKNPAADKFARRIVEILAEVASECGYTICQLRPDVLTHLPTTVDFPQFVSMVIGFERHDGKMAPVAFSDTKVLIQLPCGPVASTYTDTNLKGVLKPQLAFADFV